MATHISHAALPYPIKLARFTVGVPYLDADGDPLDPTTPDTERSIDGAAFADCTEEVTTITGSNGMGYITLTSTEMDASFVGMAAKVASGPKNTLATIYPRNLPTLSSGTLSAGSAGGGTLGTILPYDITNCFIRTTGGTGGGSGGNQARRIVTYTISTGAFTVTPNWETTPDNTTTYDVLLPEGVTPAQVKGDTTYWKGGLIPTQSQTGVPEVDLTHIDGSAVTLSNVLTYLSNFNAIIPAIVNGELWNNTVGSTGNDDSHVHLNKDGQYADDEFNNHLVVIFDSSANNYYARWVTDFVGATSLVTLDTALPASVQNATDTYWITNIRRDANVTHFGGSAGSFSSGIPRVDLLTILGFLPDDQIRAAIVDDDTRIDASALNTLSTTGVDTILDSIRIRKNTELAAFTFRMVSSSNHTSGATGLTVTATRSIDGGAFASCANSVSEISNGWYKITLAAADLNGDVIALNFSAANADTVGFTLLTQPTD